MSDGGGRHDHYNTMIDASHGNYWDRVLQETWRKWEGIIYEPANAAQGDKRQVHVVINLLPQIVEAKRALWSVMPQIRVPYRSLDDADMKMSDMLERTYSVLWNENRMGEKLGDGGWYAALLGTAVFCVYPDIVAKRPRVVARSPYGFYGTPGNIEQDGSTWKRCIFVTRMKSRQAAAMWPGKGIAESGEAVNVVEYWDESVKYTVLKEGAIILDGPIQNKLGKVPVVTIPNIAQPGQWWGKGDGDDAVPAINELNKRFNVENQAFSDQAGAPWEATGLDMEAEDVSLDPDAINRFQPGGGLKKSVTGGLPWQIYQSNQLLRQYVDSLTDFPEVMRSMYGGSNVSGKAINNLMGPIQARMELRQRYLYPRLEILNKLMMETLCTYWGGETIVLRGSEKGKRYNFELIPDEAFEGYWENEVFLDSSSYFDVQSKIVLGLQMVAAQGCSTKTFVQKLNPFTDNWEEEHEQIQREQQERIQLAMTAQMMSMNPMGANPDVGQPMQDNKSLTQGSETSAQMLPPPPGMTEDMAQQGGMAMNDAATAMGNPFAAAEMPSGDMGQLTMVADLIRATPKVIGRVFLAGSIVDAGKPGPEGIEIWFTDMVDWATVRQFVGKEEPDLAGQFNPMQGIPSTPYIEVTPGTSGYELQQPEGLAEENLMAQPPVEGGIDSMAGPGGPAMMPPPDMMGGGI